MIAFAGVLLAYGATELIEGYGFIAAFVAGLTLRRSESTPRIPQAAARLLRIDRACADRHPAGRAGRGAADPVAALHWPRNALIAAVLILVIRPAAAWCRWSAPMLHGRERAVVAFYGVRGIGSIYYLAYAGHQWS